MAYTFKGGVWPDDHKYTKNIPIEEIVPTAKVSVSLSQHVGIMCKPVVKVGEQVRMGQLIGDVPGGLGCPVHASVSGTVVQIEEVTAQRGGTSYNIVIENDGQNTLADTVQPFGKKLSEATSEEIIAAVRAAGITGMGAAAFPTYAKLAAAAGRADTLIINCIESEPFACAGHRLVLENPAAIIHGLKIIMVALGIQRAWIAVDGSRKEERAALQPLLGDTKLIQIKKVTSKYPAGSEKQLVYALTKKEIPGGRTPLDVGIVVFNAQTCAAIYEALAKEILADGAVEQHSSHRGIDKSFGTDWNAYFRFNRILWWPFRAAEKNRLRRSHDGTGPVGCGYSSDQNNRGCFGA